MTANANVVDLVKGKSTLVRPKYSPGLLLRDDDLKVGVDYTRELSRLLFRSLFGCGVVCGLTVTSREQCGKLIVTVAKGVALNGIGDPIYVPEDQNIIVDPTCGKDLPPKIWVILCRTDKCCAPRSTVCGCEEEDSPSVCTREQETFEIRLINVEPDKCSCMCPKQQPAGTSDGPANAEPSDCWCADPCGCLMNHYLGECDCSCCDPDCVVLAVLTDTSNTSANPNAGSGTNTGTATNPWTVSHNVRRFVRPVLMRDPAVWQDEHPGANPCDPPVVLLSKESGNAPAAAKAKAQTAQPSKAVGRAGAAAVSTGPAKGKQPAGTK